MIDVRRLSFRYGRGPRVLDGVTLDVRAGELVAVVGSNGSGKSTLVALIDGLLEPEQGEISLEGRALSKMKRTEIARLVAYVGQSAVVRFPLRVLEYVLQGRFVHGHVFGFESRDDIDEAYLAMDLTATRQFETRRLEELSGGERQRVMLARALAQRPRILLLDEPTANLDIAHQVRTLELVRRLTRTQDLAAIVVTHELNLAAVFADRIGLLQSGRLAAYGPPEAALTEGLLTTAFGTPLVIDSNPASGSLRVTPVIPTPAEPALPVGGARTKPGGLT